MSLPAKCTDQEFIEMVERFGVIGTAKRLKGNVRAAYRRRANLEKKHRIIIKPAPKQFGAPSTRTQLEEHPARRMIEVKDGNVLIGSDCHYWPGIVSTAHRAFVYFNKKLKPAHVIKNGDVMDFPSVSRHAPIMWEKRPSVINEIEAAQDRLHEVTEANKNAKYWWTFGNHDGLYETKLATLAPEYARVKGFHLKDHFPRWTPCWSVWINDDVVVKHRWANGIHAVHNNAVKGGKNIVTGHLHSLKVTPWTDYNGTRFGVDCGTMAHPYGPQFENYMEDNARNWRSGFVILTFHKGKLLWPELVHVIDEENGLVEFRGEVYEV